ncbi:enamine deaminase RidA (YjgF/YER057c/UK114 family) [Bradyrhizobium sp. LM3.2]
MIKRVLPYEGLLHEAVEHNGVLYIGGIVPEDTSLDMSGQANDVLGQLAQLLKTLGSDLTNVLQVTIYMTNLKEKAEFNATWKGAFCRSSSAGARRNRRGRSRSGRQTRDHGHRRSTIVARRGPNSDDLQLREARNSPSNPPILIRQFDEKRLMIGSICLAINIDAKDTARQILRHENKISAIRSCYPLRVIV